MSERPKEQEGVTDTNQLPERKEKNEGEAVDCAEQQSFAKKIFYRCSIGNTRRTSFSHVPALLLSAKTVS